MRCRVRTMKSGETTMRKEGPPDKKFGTYVRIRVETPRNMHRLEDALLTPGRVGTHRLLLACQ